MREIDLNEWEQFGEGGEAVSYYSKSDDSLMLKLYNTNIDRKKIHSDYEKSRFLIEHSIKTPKAIEEVSCKERVGVIFERVKNKISLYRLFAKDPTCVEEYSKIHAQLLKRLHSIDANEIFESPANEYGKGIEYGKKHGIITDEEAAKLEDLLKDDTIKKVVMMDPHPGNTIVADGEAYLIDLGGSACGNPKFDLGNWYAFSHALVKMENQLEVCHVGRDIMTRSWNAFVREYYATDDNNEIERIEKSLRPYAAIVWLWCSSSFPAIVNREKDFKPWIYGEE